MCLPILIKLENLVKTETSRKTFWNFKRANWQRFASITDVELSKIEIENQPLDTTFSEICSSILKAATLSVPKGNYKKYRPFWNKDLQEAVLARRRARRKAAKDPTPANRTDYNRKTAKVRLLTRSFLLMIYLTFLRCQKPYLRMIWSSGPLRNTQSLHAPS